MSSTHNDFDPEFGSSANRKRFSFSRIRARRIGRSLLESTDQPVVEDQAEATTEPTSELYEQFAAMLQGHDTPLASRYLQGLYDKASTLPNYDAILAYEQTISDLYAQRNSTSGSEFDDLDKQVLAMTMARRTHFDTDEYNAVREIERKLEDFKQGKIHLLTDDDDAAAIIDLIRKAPSVVTHEEPQPAPFSAYASNTDETWAYVPSAEADDFLDNKPFLPYVSQRYAHTGMKLSINRANHHDAIEIPTETIVHAAGFESWHGRGRGPHGTYNNKSVDSPYGGGNVRSKNAIKHYAALPSELPPIDVINVYIQPNGTVFADNDDDGPHRVAAAVLRGDEFVKAANINVQLLSSNIF